MSNILVNFSKANEGGGKNILDNFLANSKYLDSQNVYYIITPSYTAYSKYNSPNIFIIEISKFWLKNLFFLALYYYYYKKFIKQHKIDLVLNFGDVIIPTKIKQIYYFDWAYAVYSEDYIWQRMGIFDRALRKIKVMLIDRYIKDVSLVYVQTTNMKNRLAAKYNLNKIYVIGTPVEITNAKIDPEYYPKNLSNKKKMLYPASFSPHKNFEIILDLALEIKMKCLPYVIFLTIDESISKKFIENIKLNQIEKQIVNLGKLDRSQIYSAYLGADAIFMPTLLESYGLPYFEAMYFKKLIITSNLDFSKEICRDCAEFFNPFDVKSIIDAFELVLKDENNKNAAYTKKGFEIYQSLPTWAEVFASFELNIEKILNT
jgi:hypothetical protein